MKLCECTWVLDLQIYFGTIPETKPGIRRVCFRIPGKLIVAWDWVTVFLVQCYIQKLLTKFTMLWVDGVILGVWVLTVRKHLIWFWKEWISKTLCCQVYHFLRVHNGKTNMKWVPILWRNSDDTGPLLLLYIIITYGVGLPQKED